MFTGWKPNVELSPACPRCGSANTKFCYYNNYSLTQPRYFCKGCRRYWTKGGSLRNVPIGGGCRKSRRGKSSIRVSTDGGVGSRNGIESNGSISISTSGGGHDRASTGSIDLAAVYANFLNQTTPRHDNNDNRNVNEGVSVSHEPDGIVNNNSNIVPVMEFSGFQGFHMNSHLDSHLPQEISHGFFDYGQFNSRLSETTPLLGSGNSMFFGGPDGFCEKTGNGLISTSNIINPVEEAIILPPLPGEDVAAPPDQAGILWPDSDVILQNQNDLLRSNDHETQAGQNSEVLDGNLNMMSPFTALNNLEAIFRS